MRVIIYGPDGEKVQDYTLKPRANVPAMFTEENGDLHVAGLLLYSPIHPPWKIEITSVNWATSKEGDP